MLIVMFSELVNLVKLGCLIIFGNLGRQFFYCHSVILLALFHISTAMSYLRCHWG